MQPNNNQNNFKQTKFRLPTKDNHDFINKQQFSFDCLFNNKIKSFV